MSELALTGPWGAALDGLRELLANTPYFKTWVSAADATAAKKSILFGWDVFKIMSWSLAADGAVVLKLDHDVAFEVGTQITVSKLDSRVNGARTVVSVTGNAVALTVAATVDPVALEEAPELATVYPLARPFAVIYFPAEKMRSQQVATATPGYGGELEITLDAAFSTDAQNNQHTARIEMNNVLGGLVAGMAALAGTDAYMIANSIRPDLAEPVPVEEQEDNRTQFEAWNARILVDYGVV